MKWWQPTVLWIITVLSGSLFLGIGYAFARMLHVHSTEVSYEFMWLMILACLVISSKLGILLLIVLNITNWYLKKKGLPPKIHYRRFQLAHAAAIVATWIGMVLIGMAAEAEMIPLIVSGIIIYTTISLGLFHRALLRKRMINT